MASRPVETLLDELRRRYGERLIPYGTSAVEKHGTGFRLEGVPAVFSVLTLDGTLQAGRFDVQIESFPPGEYAWADEYELDALLNVIADIERGVWPGSMASQ